MWLVISQQDQCYLPHSFQKYPQSPKTPSIRDVCMAHNVRALLRRGIWTIRGPLNVYFENSPCLSSPDSIPREHSLLSLSITLNVSDKEDYFTTKPKHVQHKISFYILGKIEQCSSKKPRTFDPVQCSHFRLISQEFWITLPVGLLSVGNAFLRLKSDKNVSTLLQYFLKCYLC